MGIVHPNANTLIKHTHISGIVEITVKEITNISFIPKNSTHIQTHGKIQYECF